jgi:hypothetical protein
MVLGFPGPDPDPFVKGADPNPAPDPSFSHKCLERTEIVLYKIEF